MSGHNPRRTNSTKRNALRKRVLREESVCGICTAPVDVTLPHGMPESPEVDEIVPVSKGGDPYDRKNCRLVHRLCNQRRGNGDRDTLKEVQVAPLRTSRQW